MPTPDPVPSPRDSMMRRFWRIFRLLALLSVVIAAIAVARGDPILHINMLIATALGVGFTVLLGSGLMALMFLSSSSGHDEQAAPHVHQENDEE